VKEHSGYVGLASEKMQISPEVGFMKSYDPYPIANIS
jgi:hypothetical protein